MFVGARRNSIIPVEQECTCKQLPTIHVLSVILVRSQRCYLTFKLKREPKGIPFCFCLVLNLAKNEMLSRAFSYHTFD